MEQKDTIVEEEIVKDEVQEEILENEETTKEIEDNVVDIEEKLEEQKLTAEIDALNDKYARLNAEYTNYRRRTQEDISKMSLTANEKILTELIPVIDSMERALEACTDKEDTMFKGVELVYKQLKDMMTKFGLEEIEAEDTDFDPNLHLAVMQESIDGVEPNKVVMVLQKGYKLGNKVLRASMVKVSC